MLITIHEEIASKKILTFTELAPCVSSRSLPDHQQDAVRNTTTDSHNVTALAERIRHWTRIGHASEMERGVCLVWLEVIRLLPAEGSDYAIWPCVPISALRRCVKNMISAMNATHYNI